MARPSVAFLVRVARPIALHASVLFLAFTPLVMQACGPASAAATKPLSPADGAADYKENPMGPATTPVVPTPGGEPSAPGSASGEPVCPPKCGADASWVGCGLPKPRGTQCTGCTPKCKGKGSADEGWYDCSGVLIVRRPCA